jgi:hypothetical protein
VAEALGTHRLDLREEARGWSAREVVHHPAESETTSAIRRRRLIAEDRPSLTGHDEAEVARTLFYDRPIEASLELLRAARAATAEILDRLTEEQWRRQGTYGESDPYYFEEWLRIYAEHTHEHAAQMLRAGGLQPVH